MDNQDDLQLSLTSDNGWGDLSNAEVSPMQALLCHLMRLLISIPPSSLSFCVKSEPYRHQTLKGVEVIHPPIKTEAEVPVEMILALVAGLSAKTMKVSFGH